MNPNSPNAWPDLKETEAAAQALGLQLTILKASTASEIDAAFTSFSGNNGPPPSSCWPMGSFAISLSS